MIALAIGFSRDRPLQLDAAVRSLHRHCRDAERLRLVVVYRATSRAQGSAYRALAEAYASTRFRVALVPETDFERNVRDALADASTDRAVVLFLVDDVLFVRPFELGAAADLLDREPELLAVSLRLGRNTTYLHPLGRSVTAPPFAAIDGVGDDGLLRVTWVDADGDFGYPFDLSSSVYRGPDLVAALDGLRFDGPNLLEHRLWERRHAFAARSPRLALFERARAFSAPLNRVQAVAPNPTSAHRRHDPAVLLDRFRRGWRVDVAAYDGSSPPTCHFETELLLRRADGVAAP